MNKDKLAAKEQNLVSQSVNELDKRDKNRKTPRNEEEPHYERLFKLKDEYDAKKKQKLDKIISDITFQPQTTKNKNYTVQKDVIERNNDFIVKKNEKIQKMIQTEKDQLKF